MNRIGKLNRTGKRNTSNNISIVRVIYYKGLGSCVMIQRDGRIAPREYWNPTRLSFNRMTKVIEQRVGEKKWWMATNSTDRDAPGWLAVRN